MLCDRLEAATSRLEDMATSLDGPNTITPPVAAAVQATVPQASAKSTPPSMPPPPVVEPVPQSVEDFDIIINRDVKAFVDVSQKIGELVAEQV